jgi:hypothetical protein
MAMRSTNEQRLVHEKALSLFNGASKMEFFQEITVGQKD